MSYAVGVGHYIFASAKIDDEVHMEKKEEEQVVVTPEPAKPVQKQTQSRWPGQNANAGFKNSKSVQGRRPVGRGAARGR